MKSPLASLSLVRSSMPVFVAGLVALLLVSPSPAQSDLGGG